MLKWPVLFFIWLYTASAFLCGLRTDAQALIKESPSASDSINVFSSSDFGISFQYDKDENVDKGDNLQTVLCHHKEPIVLIQLHVIRDSSLAIHPNRPKDVARSLAVSLAQNSFDRPEATDHTGRVDSVTEFTNRSGLRILICYRTELSENWGKESTINAIWKACPEYFIDLSRRGTVIEFRWLGTDSLAVPRLSRLIETVVPF